MLAIEINDSGIAVASGDEVVLESPGYALLDENKVIVGEAAYQAACLKPRQVNNRFWNNLNVEPLGVSNALAKTHADLVDAHLKHILRSMAEREVIVTVPGSLRKEQLGLLLGIGKQQKIPIRGVVDSALSSTMDYVTTKSMIHLDIHLHGCVVSRLEGQWTRQREAVETVSGVGLVSLRDKWIHLIANEFIRLTRFDPLYRAESEQSLYNRLSGWMHILQSEKTLELEMRRVDHEFRIGLDRKRWIDAVATDYQEITQRIGRLLVEDNPLLAISHRMDLLPGFGETLKEKFPKSEVVVLSEGAAALGALDYSDQIKQAEDAIFFTTRLDSNTRAYVSPQSKINPTHLVHRGYAYPVGDVALEISKTKGKITIISGKETSSARFTLGLQENEIVLKSIDCKGLEINGMVITEMAVVSAGDIINFDGEELSLITIVNQQFIG